MNFDKPMIDLVREIRKRVESQFKPGVKLANPELFRELLTAYKGSSDTIMKTLIKELFVMAGDDWAARLETPTAESAETVAGQSQIIDGKRFITKVYRGQTQLVEVKDSATTAAPAQQKIYRGQVVG